MENTTLLSGCRCLNGSHLKLIAIVCMLIDHTAVILGPTLDLFQTSLFSSFTVYSLMRKVGRLAFPLFCFLLTEGFIHTKSRLKYGCRLLAFALLSEIPFNLMHNGTLLYPGAQNIYFTLLLGFLVLCLLESSLPEVYKLLILVPGVVLVSFLHVDYGTTGVLLILLMYLLREQKLMRSLLALPFLSGGYAAWCAFVFIGLYNGKRGFISGKVLKYAFYVFYPAHILLLYGIRYLLTL